MAITEEDLRAAAPWETALPSLGTTPDGRRITIVELYRSAIKSYRAMSRPGVHFMPAQKAQIQKLAATDMPAAQTGVLDILDKALD